MQFNLRFVISGFEVQDLSDFKIPFLFGLLNYVAASQMGIAPMPISTTH
jgi:hypothetical protein